MSLGLRSSVRAPLASFPLNLPTLSLIRLIVARRMDLRLALLLVTLSPE